VRAIRETWGADSATNVVRRETFYRDEVRQRTWLRVHVIPPLDGIYAQWDFNAGRVTRFYNTHNAAGVAIDGRNGEAFGNLDDPCNPNYDANDTSAADQGYRSAYYRDDSCFDDGTGADPGPKVNPRSGDEPRTASDGSPRRCWHPEDGAPDGTDRFFQGSIATHGLHLLFLAESDNARQTVPTTEIVSDWTLVMLPGDQGNVGERYGRSFEHPLVATVSSRHS